MALLDHSFNTLHEFWFILNKQSGSPSFLWHSLLQKKWNKFPKSLERIYSQRQGSDTTPLGSAQILMYRPMPPAGKLLKIASLNIFKMSSLGLFLCISFHFVTLTPSSSVNSLTLIFSFARSWDLCLNGSHLYGKTRRIWLFFTLHYYYSNAMPRVGPFSIRQCFSFCPAESPNAARLWVRLNVCVNVFALIKQTSLHWDFVSRISLPGPDRSPTAA